MAGGPVASAPRIKLPSGRPLFHMTRLPTRTESIFVVLVFVLLFAVGRCNADDAIDSPLGKIELISDAALADLERLETGTKTLAVLKIKGAATFAPFVDWQHFNTRSIDGYSYCAFWTGTTEQRVRWMCRLDDGRSYQFAVIIGKDVDPDPDPPAPDPDLNTRAKWARDEARKVIGSDETLRKEAAAIATTYDTVASAIKAGGITDTQTAKVLLKAEQAKVRIVRKWKPLIDKTIAGLNRDAGTDVSKAGEICADLAAGFNAAAK